MGTRILILGLFLIILANKERLIVSVTYDVLLDILKFIYFQQAGVLMKFTNAICKSFNESMIKINMCRIRAVNRYKNIFNLNATLLQSMYSVKTRFQLYKRANGYKPWLYDISIDNCEYLKKPSNPIAIFLVNQFKNFSNFWEERCPITVCF